MHTGNRLSRSWWGTGQEEIIDFIFGLHGKTGGMIEEFSNGVLFILCLVMVPFYFPNYFFLRGSGHEKRDTVEFLRICTPLSPTLCFLLCAVF